MQQAVARVFKGRFQIGEFDPASKFYADIDNSTVFSAAHQQLALEGAEQAIVLAHNAPLGSPARLPIKRGLKLALIGPNGDSASVYQGQYHGPSCPEQPANSGYYGCLPTAFSAIKKANTAGGATSFVNGCGGANPTGTQDCTKLVNQSAVKAAVAAADVVILILGEDIGVTNSEGTDRNSYQLAGKQTTLAQMVVALGKPTVAIVLSGGAVGMDWIASQPAMPLLIPGYSGIFGPQAIARTLFGDVAPSGLLPYTVYPESWGCSSKHQLSSEHGGTLIKDDQPRAPCRNDLHDMGLASGDGRTYRWYGYNNHSLQAAIPFGTGEYYTEFDVQVAKKASGGGAAAAVADGGMGAPSPVATYAITIRNVGQVASRCRVMLFIKPVALSSAAPRPLPVKSIVDFGGTSTVLSPNGGTETLSFGVTLEALSLTDWAGKRAAYEGKYEVLVSIGNGTVAGGGVQPLALAATTVLDQLPPPPSP
jgi:hypothetical protein